MWTVRDFGDLNGSHITKNVQGKNRWKSQRNHTSASVPPFGTDPDQPQGEGENLEAP